VTAWSKTGSHPRLLGRFAKSLCALFAGTNRAQVVIAVDAGGMTVVECDLEGVIPHLRGGIGPGLWLVHRQQRRSRKIQPSSGFFFAPLVIACSTGALLAQIRKIEMAAVTIGPCDIHARRSFHMDSNGRWFLALVKWCRHGKKDAPLSLQIQSNSQHRELENRGCAQQRRITACTGITAAKLE
jgi:hypothetical protein